MGKLCHSQFVATKWPPQSFTYGAVEAEASCCRTPSHDRTLGRLWGDASPSDPTWSGCSYPPWTHLQAPNNVRPPTRGSYPMHRHRRFRFKSKFSQERPPHLVSCRMPPCSPTDLGCHACPWIGVGAGSLPLLDASGDDSLHVHSLRGKLLGVLFHLVQSCVALSFPACFLFTTTTRTSQ